MALMHFFPEEARVHSIVLDSPYPLPEDQVNDLAASSALQYPTLLDQLFAACAQDEPCNGAYPELGARYAALVARLAAAPMKLPDGSNFTAEDLQRSIFPFTPAIGFVPYMPRLIAELEAGDTSTLAALQSNAIPGSHHLTALGVEHPRVGELIDAYLTCTTDAPDDSSWQAYAQRLLGLWDAAPADVVAFLTATCLDGSGATASALVQELPAGVFNSIIMRFAPEQTPGVNMMLNGKLRCTEQVPFAPEPQAVMERLCAVDLPEFFVQETAAGIAAFRDGCEGWSNARAAPAPSTYGNYPVLILSGDFDATTPPAFAQIAAAQLPQASLIAVPNATHSILGNYGDCVTGITRQFLGGPTQPVDTACTAAMRIPWSMPDEPLPGAATGGAAGQAATPAAAPDAWEDADCIGLTGFSSFEEVLGAMSRCGYLVVPKDHFDPANTNTLKVAIMVVDEVREPQLPVFYLHGGPGGGVIGGEFAAARAMVFQAVDR
jgi:pimeloyl-ACP methyl ester carboxylesterase